MKCRQLTLVAMVVLAGAAPPPPPPPKPAPPPPRQPGAWERIQAPLDRSMGRITDETTYEVERLNRLRDERFGRIEAQSDFERLQDEIQRRRDLDERYRRAQKQRSREELLDLREYELFLYSGMWPVASQAAADEQALREAKARRDQQLFDADVRRYQAVQQNPRERAAINEQYRVNAGKVREEYRLERERILGHTAATPPTTQP